MPYIGTQIEAGNYRKLTNIASGFNGITTVFTLSVPPGTSQYYVTPTSTYQLLISVGGIIQQPDTDYTVSTNTITFTTAPTGGLSFFGILMGDALNIGTPSDGTVTTAKLASSAVSNDKLADSSVTQSKIGTNVLTPTVSQINGGPLAGTRNRIINGDMRIDQRNDGASVTLAAQGYVLDRWYQSMPSSSKYSVIRSTTAPAGFTNSLRIASLSSYTVQSNETFYLGQRIEGYNVSDLNWGTASAETVTLSFWVYSSLTGTFGGALTSYPNNNRAYPFTYAISSANTWTYVTVTAPGDTTGTWLTGNNLGISVTFSIGSGSSFSATAGSWATGQFTSATGATNNTLNAGDVVTATATFSEAVTVDTTSGTPYLSLNIGGTTVQAAYASGSGTTALTFTYTVLSGQTDANGISIDLNSLNLNSGTIKDAAGNSATITHTAVTDNASYMVDTTAPTASVTTATLANTSSATVQSSETGTAYLVKSSVSVTNEASITSAADTAWNSVAISSANTNTSLALTGLLNGSYQLYTVDAAGNLSTVSTNSVTVSTSLSSVDLSAIAAGSGGFVINGQCAGDNSGFTVSSAGDVNGDGTTNGADLAILLGAWGECPGPAGN